MTPTTKHHLLAQFQPAELHGDLKRLAKRVKLTPITLGVAMATLALLAFFVSYATHLPTYLSTHPVSWWLLAILLIVDPFIYVGNAICLVGAAGKQLPLARTIELQAGESVTAMLTPESVGSAALTMRFLAKCGLDSAAAAAAFGVCDIVSVGSGLVVFAVAAATASSSLNVSQLKGDVPSGEWVTIAVIIAMAILVTIFIKAPSMRSKIIAWFHRAGVQILSVVKRPLNGLIVVLGELLSMAAMTACMCIVLSALHQSANLSAIIVICALASSASSVVPIPGGLGAPEAIVVAGLAAVGVEHNAALIAAVLWRIAVYWGPPIPGAALLYDLQRRNLI